MKLKNRMIALILSLVMTLLMSSCTMVGKSPDQLIRPPRPTGEYAGIQRALEEVAEDFTLKYPETGDYRSAFIERDLDGDGKKEFIAFYVSDTTNEYHINMIKKEEDNWKSVGDLIVGADEDIAISRIERVDFCDLDRDGVDEIITGWSSVSRSGKQMYIYKFEDARFVLKRPETYTEYAVVSISPDGGEDLLLLRLNEAAKSSSASIIRLDGDKTVSIGNAVLDGNVTEYVKITAGNVAPGLRGVFIDSMKGSSVMITELLYFGSEGGLTNPFYDMSNSETWLTMREAAYACRDINGDGIIEIPTLEPLRGYADLPPGERQYYTHWNQFGAQAYDGKDILTVKLDVVLSTYMNYTDGYYFVIPEQWLHNNITVEADVANRMRVFYEWRDGKFADELVSIQAVVKSAAQEQSNALNIKLGEQLSNGQIYYAALGNPSNRELQITSAQLLESFHMLL